MAAYLKHLAWWTLCGTLVVALAGALAGAATGGMAAGHDSISSSFGWNWDNIGAAAVIGGLIGAYSGAICGAVALLVLAITRPPLHTKSAHRLRLVLSHVGLAVLGGTFALGAGTVLVGALISSPQGEGFILIVTLAFRVHFLFVALPAIVGTLSAGRALSRLEKEVMRALPTTRA